jgi:hypothetical protein
MLGVSPVRASVDRRPGVIMTASCVRLLFSASSPFLNIHVFVFSLKKNSYKSIFTQSTALVTPGYFDFAQYKLGQPTPYKILFSSKRYRKRKRHIFRKLTGGIRTITNKHSRRRIPYKKHSGI